eukprot:m.42771 g.42771  ORF g.42771 m.42771 type:complete len:570 (+) comp9910_c0_seq1:2092-3801(+)
MAIEEILQRDPHNPDHLCDIIESLETLASEFKELHASGENEDHLASIVQLLEAMCYIPKGKSALLGSIDILHGANDIVKANVVSKDIVLGACCVVLLLWEKACAVIGESDGEELAKLAANQIIESAKSTKGEDKEEDLLNAVVSAIPFATSGFINHIGSAPAQKALTDILKKPKERSAECIDTVVDIVTHLGFVYPIDKSLQKAAKGAKVSDKTALKIFANWMDPKAIRKSSKVKAKDTVILVSDFSTSLTFGNIVDIIKNKHQIDLIQMKEDDLVTQAEKVLSAQQVIFYQTPRLQRSLSIRHIMSLLNEHMSDKIVFLKTLNTDTHGWVSELVSGNQVVDTVSLTDSGFEDSISETIRATLAGESVKLPELNKTPVDVLDSMEDNSNNDNSISDSTSNALNNKEDSSSAEKVEEIEPKRESPEVASPEPVESSDLDEKIKAAIDLALKPVLERLQNTEKRLEQSEDMKRRLAEELQQAHLRIDDLSVKVSQRGVVSGGSKESSPQHKPAASNDPKMLSARSQMAAVMRAGGPVLKASPPKSKATGGAITPNVGNGPLHEVFGEDDLE